jgi:hypothetical protein
LETAVNIGLAPYVFYIPENWDLITLNIGVL